MIIFDGYQLADQIETRLKAKVEALAKDGRKAKIAAILFVEDQGSQLYTQLKREAAQRVGIEYRVDSFSMRDDLEILRDHIQQLNQDQTVTGIIIQKPWTSTWAEVTSNEKEEFVGWWHFLTDQIDQAKDVDGLTGSTLTSIKENTWLEKGYVMPATAQAVIKIFDQAKVDFNTQKFIIIGKSDILGKPLYYWLKNNNAQVEMIGSRELTNRIDSGQYLHDADVVISSTGRQNLITGQMVKDGVVLLDVGEPKGDIDIQSVAGKPSFITPVPGGVGPMTVVCLLENAVKLIS